MVARVERPIRILSPPKGTIYRAWLAALRVIRVGDGPEARAAGFPAESDGVYMCRAAMHAPDPRSPR